MADKKKDVIPPVVQAETEKLEKKKPEEKLEVQQAVIPEVPKAGTGKIEKKKPEEKAEVQQAVIPEVPKAGTGKIEKIEPRKKNISKPTMAKINMKAYKPVYFGQLTLPPKKGGQSSNVVDYVYEVRGDQRNTRLTVTPLDLDESTAVWAPNADPKVYNEIHCRLTLRQVEEFIKNL